MTHVALYARYSSDQQSASSIDDQFRICREQAAREGWQVTGTYKDAAISGSSVTLRPGIQQLLQDAQSGHFTIILAEALDRVSRDQADVATLFKHLQFAGVTLVTLAEGEISELHVGLKGTMNALFLKDLAKKTHRGMRGRVEKGKAGGGLCYGYDVVKRFDSEGEPIRGERSVNTAQAEIVRRVFREYGHGVSPQTIARRLNDEGVPGPEGKLWAHGTLRGHAKRGTGVLNNELYIGRLVWNRQRYVKDPRSGRRVSRINAESEWIIADVPELRIIDDALWEAAKARQAFQRNMPARSKRCAAASACAAPFVPSLCYQACSIAASAGAPTRFAAKAASRARHISIRAAAIMVVRSHERSSRSAFCPACGTA